MAVLNVHLVTLGNGPRPEYETIFLRELTALGLNPVLTITHILDPLGLEAIETFAASDGEPAILSRVRDANGIVANRPLSRAALVPLIEAAIDDGQDRADVTVVCVAEYLPLRQRDHRVILPFAVIVERLHALTDASKPIALCPYGDRQRDQQIQTWTENGGFAAERLRFVLVADDPDAMIAAIVEEGAHHGAVLAFAFATEDHDLLARFDAAQQEKGCTILLPFRETIRAITAPREVRK